MQIGQRFVADALAVEEACASAVLSVAVNSDGSVSFYAAAAHWVLQIADGVISVRKRVWNPHDARTATL